MRYLLFIIVMTLFFIPGKQEAKLKTIGVKAAQECWENSQGCIQLNEDDFNFELPDNNDFDGPLSVLIEPGHISDEQCSTGVRIYSSTAEVIRNAVPYSLIDLPPPFVS